MKSLRFIHGEYLNGDRENEKERRRKGEKEGRMREKGRRRKKERGREIYAQDVTSTWVKTHTLLPAVYVAATQINTHIRMRHKA